MQNVFEHFRVQVSSKTLKIQKIENRTKKFILFMPINSRGCANTPSYLSEAPFGCFVRVIISY